VNGYGLRIAFLLLSSLTALVGCGGGVSTHSSPPPPVGTTFTPASTQAWLQQFGPAVAPPSADVATNVLSNLATDSGGNAGYTLGSFSDASSPAGPAQDFLAKYGPSGKQLWLNEFGTGAGDFLEAVAVATTGEIVAGGETFGAYPGFSNPSQSPQAVIFKMDASGNREWVQQFSLSGSPQTSVNSVATLSDGDVYAAGVASAGGVTQSVFFCRLDGSTGKILWQYLFGSNVFDVVTAIAVDSTDDLFALGETQGAFPGTAGGNDTTYLLKIDPSGSIIWNSTVSSPNSAGILAALAVDNNGDPVLVGATLNPGIKSAPIFVVGFGAAPDERCFVTKYDGATGTQTWVQTFGTGYGDQLSGVAVDASNNIVASGITNGTFASAFSPPKENILLLKFSSSGSNQWVQQIGTGPLTNGSIPVGPVITTDSSGNIFLGAGTQGAYPGFSNESSDIEMFVSKFGP
jgi:hypothetical protein